MDESILDGLKRRDVGAFKKLFEELFSLVRYYALKITKDDPEAEDIAIQALSKFWQNDMKDFDSMKKVRNHLFKVARNSSIDYLRRQKRIHTHHQEIATLTTEEEEFLLDHAAYEVEMLNVLYKEIEKLPPRTQQIFKMVYIHSIPQKDVAAELGISVNTVYRLCSEAIQKLKKKFSEKELLLLLIIFLCKN